MFFHLTITARPVAGTERYPMKKLIVLLLLAASAASAYFYRDEVRSRYMRTYYLQIKKVTPDSVEKNAEKLLRLEKFADAARFSEDLLRVYPGNRKLLRIAGLANYRLSNSLAGAQYLLPVLTNDPDDEELILRTVGILYDERYYADVITLLTKIPPGRDPALTFYMGASLAGAGRYAEALPYLEKSEGRGSNNPDVYHFLGLVHAKRGAEDAAIENFRGALERNRLHREARRALIELYTKRQMFREAEKLFRDGMY